MSGEQKKSKTGSKEPAKSTKRINLKVRVKRSASPDLSAQWRQESAQQHSSSEKGLAKQATKSKKRRTVLQAISRGEKKVIKKKRKRIFRRVKDKKIKPKTKKENLASRERDEVLYEKVVRDKRFMMWTGVTFFMILITFFWIYNTRQVFEQSNIERNNDFSLTDWQELTDEISEKMNQMKQDWENIESFSEAGTGSPARLPDTSTSSAQDSGLVESEEQLLFSTSTEFEISQEELNKLKGKLEELEEKLKDEQ